MGVGLTYNATIWVPEDVVCHLNEDFGKMITTQRVL